MSDRREDIVATPFDRAWSTLSNFLTATGIAVFLLLTIGDAELFNGDSSTLTDGVVVGTAFFGAAVLSAGLILLGGVGHAALSAPDGPRHPPWPRYRQIEDDEGRRSRALAIGSLVFIAAIQLIVLYTCIYKYITKSTIALWDQTKFSNGFWPSRFEAYEHDCGTASACFRMYPSDSAPQWFLWTDLLLAVLIATAFGIWLTLAVRMSSDS